MSGHTPQRLIKAYVRDTRVLLIQSRFALLSFALLLIVGTFVIRLTYGQGLSLTWLESLHAALKLMFFETVLPFPNHPISQTVFLLWPVLGVVLVVNGIVRFGTALFHRRERKEAWQVAVASTYRNHIVVCGLGKVGYRVVLQLLKMQHDIVGVEQDGEAPFLEELRDEGVTVLIGDARQGDLLDKASLHEASALVACTESDLTNLAIALEAREMRPDIKVVMRMFDQHLAERVSKGFGIRTAFSTSALSAPAFAAAATRAVVEHSFYVDDVLLNVSRITVAPGSPLVGKTVGQIEKDLDLSIILCRGCSGGDFHPDPSLELEEGGQIVVFATLEALAHLNQMNEGSFPRQ
jgi:Trk K+ transport system NAD-binding subunit